MKKKAKSGSKRAVKDLAAKKASAVKGGAMPKLGKIAYNK
jgi:hypothetical protein